MYRLRRHHNTRNYKCNCDGLRYALCRECKWTMWCGRQNQSVLERHNPASCTLHQAKRWILGFSRMLHVRMILSVIGLFRSFISHKKVVVRVWSDFLFSIHVKQRQRQQFRPGSHFWRCYRPKHDRILHDCMFQCWFWTGWRRIFNVRCSRCLLRRILIVLN